jgi:hypothetical protein
MEIILNSYDKQNNGSHLSLYLPLKKKTHGGRVIQKITYSDHSKIANYHVVGFLCPWP